MDKSEAATKWIKFKDSQGNTITVKPDAVVGVMKASHLARGPRGEIVPSMIFCLGIQSMVDDRTVDDVLFQLGQESWLQEKM